MTDGKVPPLNTLYFYLTSYCNLRCFHCWIAPEYVNKDEIPEEIPFAILKNITDQALPLGLKGIKITGGEPFLSRNMPDLIKYAFSKHLTTDIETNGTLIDDEKASFLRENGVGQVAVSLDGPNEEVHEKVRGKEGCFRKTIAGIRLLKKHNLNVQVIMCLYKGNIDYVEETINLAEHYAVNSFKINPISSIGRGQSLKKVKMTLAVADCIGLNKKIDEEIQPRYKIRIILDIPPAFSPLKNIRKKGGRCGIKGILGILSDGRVSICGIAETLPSLILGDLKNEPLEGIWKGNRILRNIREDLPAKLEGICGRCIFKAYCLGKCRADAYYENNNLFSPFSFCEDAFSSGLFPKERIFK
jgi:SynChlorMet cassette radical SAM/SPASM protein ScmF